MAEAALISPSLEVVGIHVTPQYPAPGQEITATVSSTGDSGDFAYEWIVNGEVVAQGFEAQKVTLTVGSSGTPMEISVRLLGSLGEVRGSATKIIQPGAVDIVWEGETFVPPFYQGRPLSSGSSSVRVLAIPLLVENGRRVPASELSYQWSVNGQVLGNKSGRGKSSAEILPPFFNSPFTVSVIATTVNGSIAAQQTTTITPRSPLLILYENAPLSGVNFNRAQTGTVSLIENEMGFRAYPYFVTNPTNIEYVWEINNTDVTDDEKPRDLMVRRETGDNGIYSVQVVFRNVAEIFEKGAAAFNLSL
jgi:hypothetical protein